MHSIMASINEGTILHPKVTISTLFIKGNLNRMGSFKTLHINLYNKVCEFFVTITWNSMIVLI